MRRALILGLIALGALAARFQTPAAAPFFFIQLSDPQFGMYTADRDFAQETVNFEMAIASVNRLKPAFVVVTGDLVNKAGDAGQIAEYRRIASKLNPAIPLYNVPGNHDVENAPTPESVAAYEKIFGPGQYTFSHQGFFGIVLNSTLMHTPDKAPALLAAQDRWLRDTLTRAAASSPTHIVVFQHHPWFLSSATEADQYFNIPAARRTPLLALFHQSGVKLLVSGHYHRNSIAADGNLAMVTTGPVGKAQGDNPQSGLRVFVVNDRGISHRFYSLADLPNQIDPTKPLVEAGAPQTQLPPVVRTGDPYKRGYTDADFPRVKKLAEGVYTYEQLRSAGAEKFTTVSFFVVTTAGVLVADGQGSEAETKRLVDEIAKITPQPITRVVIGSDHGDHTAGNRAFPAGVRYYIHPNSQVILQIGDPVLVIDQTTIRLGSTEIQVRFLGRAHTGGDLSVYLPREKILFMSEAYLNRIFPAMRSAYPSEWVKTIEAAQAMDVQTFVPGHGFVESAPILKEELETFRKAILQVIAEAKRLRAAGLDADAAAAQAKFGDLESWTLRSSQGATAIRRVYWELEGKLPPSLGNDTGRASVDRRSGG